MSTSIRRLTVQELTTLAYSTELERRIDSIHLHHTWRPRHQDFRGWATIESMRIFHTQTNHWSDIAQHLTIDPVGGVWTGRNWNAPPASAVGHNGTKTSGPFMIEMLGDFDKGRDEFAGDQKEAVLSVVATLLNRWKLTEKNVKFHRDFTNAKSCPGTGIDYAALMAEIAAKQKGLAQSPVFVTPVTPFHASRQIGHDVTAQWRGDDRHDEAISEGDLAQADEMLDSARELTSARHRAIRDLAGLSRSARARGTTQWLSLKRHAINMARGELSEAGEFQTSPEDLSGVLDGFEAYARNVTTPRLVLFAHGGLVSEAAALQYSKATLEWWKSKGVYPVFLIWETGFLETIAQQLPGRRALQDMFDDAIENLVRIPGRAVWSLMKESARRTALADAGSGAPGGLYWFARMLASRWKELPPSVQVHAVGHSAGAILHSHLLPLLVREKIPVKTVSFLAPAVRLNVFLDKVEPLIAPGMIEHLSVFTMTRTAERNDDCWKLYQKSLLYMVSRAFEGDEKCPLLGLEESLTGNEQSRALFGITDTPSVMYNGPKAELHLSLAVGDYDQNPLTTAVHHGDFDNDLPTMASVVRRILGEPDVDGMSHRDFPRLEGRELFLLPTDSTLPGFGSGDGVGNIELSPGGPGASPAGGNGTYRAVCVGIDEYPASPLFGCVADSQAWAGALRSIGFAVSHLTNQQATRANMHQALSELVASARRGDSLVFQYAGHGTQLEDISGDESDRFDEALVPIDYADGEFLLDDDIGVILNKLPEGARLTMIMDCCHSGTNIRFAPLVKRKLSPTTRDRVRYLPVSADVARAFQARRRDIGGTTTPEVSWRGVIHLAACQDNEYAYESDGHGDFTSAASGMLVDAFRGGQSVLDFMSGVRTIVERRGRQHPRLMSPGPDEETCAILRCPPAERGWARK